MLFGPTEMLDETLLTHFASTTLVSKPSRLGGSPFHIYIVRPLARTSKAVTSSNSFTLEQGKLVLLTWKNPDAPNQPTERLLVTVWHNQTLRPANVSSWWTYHFAASYTGKGFSGQSSAANCLLSSLAPGEQLLVPFALPTGSNALPASLTISGTITSNTPYVLKYGPLRFQTLRERSNASGSFQGTTQG
jgi:hypothetical protein